MIQFMSEYGNRVQRAMTYANLNQEQIAKAAGIKQPSVNHMLKNAKRPSSANSLIAKACGVNAEWLATGIGEMVESRSSSVQEVSPAYQTREFVPVISSIQAGAFSEAVDIFAPGYADEWVARINGGPRVFALRVSGDSMTAPPGVNPSFPEGYIIHADPDQQSISGDCVVAKIEDRDEVTFKQLKYEDGTPYLNPLNPAHPKLWVEFVVLAKVIGASIKL